MQKKLELLEQLCRALQKERNDLNNRLGVLTKQGDKDALAPPEAHKPKLLAREEEEDDDDDDDDNEEDKEKDKGEQEEPCLLQHGALENQDIFQTPKLLEMDASSGIRTTATAVLEISQQAKTVCELQD